MSTLCYYNWFYLIYIYKGRYLLSRGFSRKIRTSTPGMYAFNNLSRVRIVQLDTHHGIIFQTLENLWSSEECLRSFWCFQSPEMLFSIYNWKSYSPWNMLNVFRMLTKRTFRIWNIKYFFIYNLYQGEISHIVCHKLQCSFHTIIFTNLVGSL